MSLKDGAGLVMNSEVGFYRQKDQLLDLMGGVDVYHEKGYEMHTATARVDLALGAASGDEPAHAQGPFGRIEGEGFTLAERGRTITFTGKAKLVLTPPKKGKK
jgi:lipopolysaccharide export system protein LptC